MNSARDIWLKINGKKYAFADLKNGPPGETSFEKNTFAFCTEWLSAQDTFSLTTSGSTGAPKKITLSRQAMEASARKTAEVLQLQPGFTSLLCLDPGYIAGKMMIVRSFVTGMNIVAVEPSSDPFATASASEKIDFTALVPYQLRAILASPLRAEKLRSLKAVLIGGAEMDITTRRQLLHLSPAFYETYGMTETISHVALRKCNQPGMQEFFHVLPGVRIEKDERGCLVISAKYLGRDKIVTNDLIAIESESTFKWLGRADSVINTGGVKVIPETIAEVVARIFADLEISNRFFIYGVPDSELGARVVLFVESVTLPAEQTILRKLKDILPKFEVPKEIRLVAKFAETATMKIDKITTSERGRAKS